MTWKYLIADDGSSMDIFDHTQDPSTDTPLETLQNDGSGFTIPDDIQTVMRNEAEKARNNNNTERWRDIHIRMAVNDIEEYTG